MKNKQLDDFKRILEIKRYSKQTTASYFSHLKLVYVFFSYKSFQFIKPVMEEHNFNRSKRCNYFTPKEVELIFKHLGFPY